MADELGDVKPETWMHSGESMLFNDELGRSLCKEYDNTLEELLTSRKFSSLGSWIDECSLCNERFSKPRSDSLDKNVQPEFLATLPEAWRESERGGDYLGGHPHRHSLWECLKANLESGFRSTIMCAAGFRVLKDNSKDFRPLLKMWRSGNLPLGFDKNHRLLVLCSSK